MSAPENDLYLTVRELSHVYEELSLLYRMSEVFSFLGIDEICSRIAEEALNTIGVQTAAVLLIDEKKHGLFTKSYRGVWNADRIFEKGDNVIWKAITSKKPLAFCRLSETEYHGYFPEVSSLMVCPLLGKAKAVGALLVADKSNSDEFFSSDSKLLMAISSQAGLAIENAILYSELETLMVGAIRSLVKALEASSCWTAGHTERVTDYALGIGRILGLGDATLERLKISALLHDIGKIATPKEILNKDRMLNSDEWLEIKRHPNRGAEILVELTQFEDIIMTIKYHHEHWDGLNGIYGMKGEAIPLMARVLSVADAFDAMTSDRPYRPMMTPDEAIKEIMRCSGTQFDPEIVKAFLLWTSDLSQQHRVFEQKKEHPDQPQ